MTQTYSITLYFICQTYRYPLTCPTLSSMQLFLGILVIQSAAHHRQILLSHSGKNMGNFIFYQEKFQLGVLLLLRDYDQSNYEWSVAWARENKSLMKIKLATLRSGCSSFNVHGLSWESNAIHSVPWCPCWIEWPVCRMILQGRTDVCNNRFTMHVWGTFSNYV